MTIYHFIAVFIGGGLGSMSRLGIGLMFRQMDIVALPFATITSNVLSCLVLGLTLQNLNISNISLSYYLIIVGFCGGFSTFSTFSFETLELIRGGQLTWAILNVLVSVVFCVFLLFVLTKSLK